MIEMFMKRKWISIPALVLSAILLGGCAENVNGSDESGKETEQSQAIVTLGEYKGLPLMAEMAEYDDMDIELETVQMYFYYIQVEEGITDRPVELGDITNIDYEGKKDGVPFVGGTAQGAILLIGSGQFIAGFEDGLIGVMPGETVDLNLTFPEYYGNAELAGQEVVFTVTVNFIPEMEDALVEEIGVPGVSTVDELRAYVRESLEAQARDTYLAAAEDEVMMQILADSTFGELPADMLAENRETYEGWLDRNAADFGMTGQAYLEMFGMDYESTVEQYAEQYTKELLVVHAIADNEGLNISDKDLDARMEEYAQNRGVTVDELLINGLTKEDYRESFLYEDVLNFVIDNSVKVSVIID